MADRGSDHIPDKPAVDHDENAIVLEDADMTPWQCVVANPKVVLWTLFANVGSLMVGYENLGLSICLAMPAFQSSFSVMVDGQPIIPAYWQSLWSAMYNVFIMVGSMCAGFIQDRLGRRSVFVATVIVASAGIALVYISKTPQEFLGGKIVCGFAMGLVLTGTQTWVSEITPLHMRGIALSANTVLLNLGLLIAVSITYSRMSIMDDSAYRVVFAGTWSFIIFLALGIFFMPESPYWLSQKNKFDAARRSLERLSPANEQVEARLIQIQHAIETERRLAAEKHSYWELLRGSNMRRTRIILICMYMPQVAGAVLSSNAPYFLNQTGLDNNTTVMLLQIAVSIGVLSALVNLFAMMRFRPRTLMFFGVGICIVLYLAMGIAGTMPRTTAPLTVIGVAVAFPSISYGPAIGSTMAVAGEVSSIKLRAQSLAIGQAFFAAMSVVWQIILPYLFNQDQANIGGNLGWIFFGMAIIYAVVLYFDVPNTDGRTYEELDLMFEMGIPARKFGDFNFENAGELKT